MHMCSSWCAEYWKSGYVYYSKHNCYSSLY